MPFSVDLISTGSHGNAIAVDGCILIDCGVSKKVIGERVIDDIDHIFVSHCHGDHVNGPLLSWLLKMKPALVRHGLHMNTETCERVGQDRADVIDAMDSSNVLGPHDNFTFRTRRGEYRCETFPLDHDVENQGFVITNADGETLIHITDTRHAKWAPDRKFDALLVEGNWDHETLFEMLESDDAATQFRATRNLRHMSVQDFERFVASHSHDGSLVVQLHESAELGVVSLRNQLNAGERI